MVDAYNFYEGMLVVLLFLCIPYSYAPGLWSNNLLDTDKGYHMFMQSCVDVGPDVCALYKPTVAEVHARINNIFASLKRRPLAVRAPASDPQAYGVADYRSARLALFTLFYAPYAKGTGLLTAPRIAQALAAAEHGDGALLAQFDASRLTPLKCECPAPGQPAPSFLDKFDSMAAIVCADTARQRLNDTVDDLEAHFSALLRDSEFGEAWPYRARCM